VVIIIEIHTRLFYQNESSINWKKRKLSQFSWIRGLDYADQLVHLLGHLGYQHTFISAHWLVDIDRFIKRFSDDIDWGRVKELLINLKQKRSARITFFLLNRYLNTPIPLEIKSSEILMPSRKELQRLEKLIFTKIFDGGFLLRIGELGSEKKPIEYGKYYFLKHLCKDNISDALNYDLGWFKSRLVKIIKFKPFPSVN
jgi:hypothetical protein